MITQLPIIVSLAVIAAVGTNPNPWQEAHSTPDITVYTREVPESNIREVKAESIITAPLERVWDVITDIEHFTEYLPYVIEARVIAQGKGDSRFEYLRLDPPLVSKRDYTLKVTSEKDPVKGKFVRQWTAANDQGPPPREDSVRLKICDGSWTLERLDDKRTRITYWLYTDPGGSVPGWLANKANTRSLPDLLHAVQMRSVDPAWTR